MNLQSALGLCTREKVPGRFSCFATVAYAAPENSLLRKANEVLCKLPAAQRNRALTNVKAAARLVAKTIGAKRIDIKSAREGWGVINADNGLMVCAFCAGGYWFARSMNGIARVHVSRVVLAWEVK